MRRKFVIFRNGFCSDLIWIGFILIMLSALIYAMVTEQNHWIVVMGLIGLPLIMLAFAFNALTNNFNILAIDENGIRIRNAFVKIKTLSWYEINNICVYQFNGTDKIKIPSKHNKKGVIKTKNSGRYNIGGVIINVPRNKPQKWIFIDNGVAENGENYFEYFVPLRKSAIIKLKYDKKIISAIKINYTKDIVEKTIEL